MSREVLSSATMKLALREEESIIGRMDTIMVSFRRYTRISGATLSNQYSLIHAPIIVARCATVAHEYSLTHAHYVHLHRLKSLTSNEGDVRIRQRVFTRHIYFYNQLTTKTKTKSFLSY